MSHPTPTRPRPSSVTAALAAGKLGTTKLLHFSLTAATPLTVIAGVTVMYALAGQIGIPVAYAAMAAILALFSIGYTAMARHILNAGAMYAFVAHGLGRPAGVGAAWIAAAGYSAMQAGLYGILGASAVSLVDHLFGVSVPWWALALAAWALIAITGIGAVDLNAGVLAVLLVAEIAVVLLFSASNFAHPAGGQFSFAALDPAALTGGGAGAVLALAYMGFIGFEAPTVYGEEARDRHRTVRRATFATVAILMVVYIAASWSMTLAAGDAAIVDLATADPDLMFTLAADQLGSAWGTVGQVLLLTSVTAAALSFHNTTARYLFALGREHVLPARLGRTSPRTMAPAAASLTQSAIAGAVIVIWALLGLDPLVHLFYFLGSAAGLALVCLVAYCGLAVLVYFWRDRRGERAWTARIAPALALLLLAVVVALSVLHFHTLLGLDADHWLPRLVPVLVVALWAAGTCWGLVLKRARPEVYAGIGRGAKAALAQDRQRQTGHSPVAVTDAR